MQLKSIADRSFPRRMRGTGSPCLAAAWYPDDPRARPHAWPPGESAMAQRIRRQDWRATALGSAGDWPVWLRTAVSALLDSPLPTVLLLGPEFLQVYNDACQPLLGSRHPDALGQAHRACWPEVWDTNEPILRQVLASGESVHFRDKEYRLGLGGDARSRFFTVSYLPVRDDQGAIHGVSVVALETTERIALERAHAALLRRARFEAGQLRLATGALEEAARHKDEFIATLAHELRNPIAPIASVGLILEHAPGGDRQLARLGEILRRQTGHMKRLIDDLLDVSRVGRGQLQLELAPVDLREVVNAAVEQVGPRMKQEGHAFSVRLAEGPLVVRGDLARLVQVLANVLHNAAKYTPAGGRVDLQATVAGPCVQIQVSDNGVGLAPAFLPLVFQPFKQAQRLAGRAENGLGLGLALVRSLVELHGGSVDAASDGVGRGSTFTVRLPLLP